MQRRLNRIVRCPSQTLWNGFANKDLTQPLVCFFPMSILKARPQQAISPFQDNKPSNGIDDCRPLKPEKSTASPRNFEAQVQFKASLNVF
jgi:hypothetical protein